MPLISSQKDYINLITDDFFSDLPSEEKALHVTIETFKSAIKNELPDSDDLAPFQKCLHDPTLYLRRTEENNPDITIGEVQLYLFKHTKKILKTAARKANIFWNKSEWKALSSLIEKGGRLGEIFNSEKVWESGAEGEVYLIEPAGRIFTAELNPINAISEVHLTVKINLETEITLSDFLAFYPPELASDNDDARFIRSLMLNDKGETIAEKKAERMTINHVMKDLRNQQIISPLQHNAATPHAKILMTYQLYHALVYFLVIDFNLISQITADQLKVLTSPVMMDHIEHEEYTMETALGFTLAESHIVTNQFYYSGIESGQFNFERDFKGLSLLESSNLNTPGVMKLIESQKISVAQARSLPAHAGKVITEEFYFTLIKNADAEYLAFLLSPELLELFGRDIKLITPHITQLLLTNPYVRFFAGHHFIKIEELSHIAHAAFETPVSDYALPPFTQLNSAHIRKALEQFIEYARHNLLNESDLNILYDYLPQLFTLNSATVPSPLNEASLLTFCTTISKHNVEARLKLLLQDKPQKLVNGRYDTFQTLAASCEHYQVHIAEILDPVIEYFLDLSLRGNRDAMASLICHQKILGLTDLHLQELYFAQRLSGIYEKRGYIVQQQIDSINKIEDDIADVARQHHIVEPYLRAAIMRRVLQIMRANIRSLLETENSVKPVFYQKVLREINHAEKSADRKREEIWKLAPWKKAFDRIVILAAEEKFTPNPDNYLNKPAESKKQCSSQTLFKPGTVLQGLKKLCDWIGELNQVVDPRLGRRNTGRIDPASGPVVAEARRNSR